MTDHSHGENVACMVAACDAMGVPVEQCANVISDDWFKAAALKTGITASDLTFAAGYIQATSNITGESWAAQLARIKKENEDGQAHPR